MSWCGVVLLSQERCKRIGLNTIKHVRACRQIRDPREVLNSAETHQGARPELTAQRLIGELVQSLQQRLTGELVQNTNSPAHDPTVKKSAIKNVQSA